MHGSYIFSFLPKSPGRPPRSALPFPGLLGYDGATVNESRCRGEKTESHFGCRAYEITEYKKTKENRMKKLTRIGRLCLLLFALLLFPAAPQTKAATVTAITVKPAKLTLVAGRSFSLLGGPGLVTWSSSKPKVASVSSEGVVTAKKKGKAVITATLNKLTASCVVKVVEESSALFSELLADDYEAKDYFRLMDLDQDKVAELIVFGRVGSTSDYVVDVYTIRDHRTVSLGSYSLFGQATPPALLCAPSFSGLVSTGYSALTDKSWKNMYCLKNGKLKLTRSLVHYVDEDTLLDVFQTGAKHTTVTEAAYNAYNKKYFKNLVSQYLLPNTKANRKATFGIS